MLNYITRRILYTIPILIGVNLITFLLFFVVNSPDDMARIHLGNKNIRPEAIQQWKKQYGYDKPLFYNSHPSLKDNHVFSPLTETIFFQKSLQLFTFNFQQSDNGRDISEDIKTRMMPSLSIALPSFILSMIANIILAIWLLFFRLTRLEQIGIFTCIVMMSISGLFYIIGGQFFVSKLWLLTPISGYEFGLDSFKFILLPVLISVFSGLGGGVRWYRILFLEELSKNYVRTARAKGLTEFKILLKHVLPNAMIPILTGSVVALPLLFMGSLILESFFAIPGLGSYTIDAINAQDFAIVRVMVFLGSFLYIIGLILTDISYTLVDPRVHLK